MYKHEDCACKSKEYARAYILPQKYENLYSCKEGFLKGTIFKDLYRPYHPEHGHDHAHEHKCEYEHKYGHEHECEHEHKCELEHKYEQGHEHEQKYDVDVDVIYAPKYEYKKIEIER